MEIPGGQKVDFAKLAEAFLHLDKEMDQETAERWALELLGEGLIVGFNSQEELTPFVEKLRNIGVKLN